jgi:CelD/BcsL family acetyltransferase involved in cellulose biosynthesis
LLEINLLVKFLRPDIGDAEITSRPRTVTPPIDQRGRNDRAISADAEVRRANSTLMPDRATVCDVGIAHASRSTIGLEVVPYSPDLWSQIGAHWQSLLEGCSDASAFLSAPWMRSWLMTFGEELRPEALLWRNGDGRVVGACLLTIRHERRGPLALRRAYLNATGEHQLSSEHNTLLCTAEHEASVHSDLVRHVRRRGADSLMLSGFQQTSAEAIRKEWPSRGFSDGFASDDRFVPLATLRDEGTPYLSTLSKNTREKIRRSIRLYEEQAGPLTVEVAQTPAHALEWFDALRRFHDARWQSQGSAGAFSTPESVKFHQRIIGEHAVTGDNGGELSAELLRIRCGPDVIGILYNLIHRGRVSFYQSGLQYTEDNRLKPGLVTHASAVQWYLDGDASEYDFLAGGPETARYKESLASGRRSLMWLEYSVPSPKMWALNRLRLWRASRRARANAAR